MLSIELLSWKSFCELSWISELRQSVTILWPVIWASSENWVRCARNVFGGIYLYGRNHDEEKPLGGAICARDLRMNVSNFCGCKSCLADLSEGKPRYDQEDHQ